MRDTSFQRENRSCLRWLKIRVLVVFDEGLDAIGDEVARMEHIVELFDCGQLRPNEGLFEVYGGEHAYRRPKHEEVLDRKDQLQILVVNVECWIYMRLERLYVGHARPQEVLSKVILMKHYSCCRAVV